MTRTLQKPEFMLLAKGAIADIIDYSVAFIKELPGNPADVILGGSGTLVSVGNVKAILTAHHVLTNLPNSGHVAILTPMRFGVGSDRIIVDMQHVRKVFIGKGDDDSLGPDLGLLLLPPVDWSKMPTGKLFYNLLKRQELMREHPPEDNRGAWVLCGMVAERTADLPGATKQGREIEKLFQGMCINAAPSRHREEAGFDYISVQVEYNPTYEGPDSFEGCSGGGLWHLLVGEKTDGSLEIITSILAGVAFYQSAKDGLRKTIECHGRQSIYRQVVETLENQPSDSSNI